MIHRSWLPRTAAWMGIVLGMSWLSAATLGQAPVQNPPPNNHRGCSPRIPYGGYFETTWRRWPCEQRLGETNPRAPVSEVLQTPQGFESLPPPKAEPQQPPQQPTTPPATPPLGTIIAPGGLLTPPEMPSEPPTKPETPKTPAGTGLPVPNPMQLPLESSPSESKPGNMSKPLDIPSTPPAPKSSFAPIPRNTQGLSSPESPALKSSPLKETKPSQTAKPAPTAVARGLENCEVVSLTSNVEPDRGVPARGAFYADPIDTAATAAKGTPVGYAEASSPAKLMTPEPAAPDAVADTAPVALPTLGLAGYCPVELLRHGRWMQGDLRWTVVHDGRIYRLSGPEQRKQFLDATATFAPVNSGNDTVTLVNENRTVPGLPAYCAVYNGRLYMFSSAATQTEFNNNPARYVPGK